VIAANEKNPFKSDDLENYKKDFYG